MNTDDLIRNLAAEGASQKGLLLESRLALAAVLGGLVALTIVIVTLGIRTDLLATFITGAATLKFIGGLAFAAGCFKLACRLSRPGIRPFDCPLMGSFFAVGIGVAVLSLLRTDTTATIGAVAFSASQCTWIISALALVPLTATLLCLRDGAPTRPAATGAVAGLMSGAIAALAFAVWCPADDVLMVTISYAAALLLSGALGAVAGKWLLVW